MEEKRNMQARYNKVKIFSKMAAGLKTVSPVLFAVLVSFLVLWNRYNSRITLTTLDMNIIFFVLFSISLVSTVAARTNKKKCMWLLGILVAIIEVYFYNRVDNSSVSILTALISFRSGFDYVWSKLLLLMLVYLLIVSIRVICWSQEDWEEIQKSNSEWRKQRKTAFWEACRERQSDRYEKYKKKRAVKQEQITFLAEERKKEHKIEAEMRAQRREANKEELEANLKQQRYQQEMRLREIQGCAEAHQDAGKSQADREKEQEKQEKRKKCIAAVIIVVTLIIYLVLPIFESGEQSVAWNWLNKVQQFVHELSGGNSYQNAKEADLSDTVSNLVLGIYSKTKSALGIGNIVKYLPQKAVNDKSNILYSEGKESFASSMAQYTIFFIALAGMLYVGVILLYRLVMQCVESFSSKGSKGGLSEFFNEYSTPVSVLIVATSMLSTFAGTGAWTFDKLPELFQNMVSIVLCIILVLITVDAVRLILKQCVEKGSLLRTSMHITFALLIDCVMGIVVGVLAELNIRGLLSSLFAFFLQGNRTPIYDKAEDALNGALDGEMKMIRHDRKMLQGAYIPHKWKKTKRRQRNNKWQSAFQHFYGRNKGRRN